VENSVLEAIFVFFPSRHENLTQYIGAGLDADFGRSIGLERF